MNFQQHAIDAITRQGVVSSPFFLYKLGIIVPQHVEHVRVHHSVKFIPAFAFEGRRQLKDVVLPEGLRKIGEDAFNDCESLERINFPSTLTAIGYSAFGHCVSLREVKLRKGITSTLTAIDAFAFCGCVSLEEADLSKVTTIGRSAFGYCRSLEWVNFPSTLTAIGDSAFDSCRSLERVSLPSTLTAIGDYAFDSCVSLREVKLRKGIQTIGRHAFKDCCSLERINIPSTVTAIGDRAFWFCVSLREVKLCGGIQVIGSDAFACCTSLDRIAIPSKTFGIISGAANHNCCLLTDGTITPTMSDQVMMASECLEHMSVTGLAEAENAINAITNNRERTREENLEQIRALFAHYELVEATTILELAIWKAKMEEFDDLNARASTSTDEYHDQTRSGKRYRKSAKVANLTSEECRVNCGAEVVIQNMLSFL
eukprot:CAMPEP_0202028500 /NCGR_PEP_ID=MMETSP0905-20130828/63482_1 /ASSEMBLY_ACC=CAM_ASM_000554 /TAXON_ID=420261 /ORGANISM="Thalassiosira antarctica, Strain CCMP982" /LENGTH=427 /DNA_ID=CAMNT_0048592209 /DNA_START=267 /DNA_END=1550 /DNA_ORIENTATION=+